MHTFSNNSFIICLSALAAISLIPSMNIKDVDSGLRGLGRDFVKVGETDLDLMFQKVSALGRTVDVSLI